MFLLVNSETANLGAWIAILKKLELKFVLSDQKNWCVDSITGIIFPGIGNFNKVAENIKREAEKYLDIFKDHPYIFNLGHGVLPETDPNMMDYLVKLVKDY